MSSTSGSPIAETGPHDYHDVEGIPCGTYKLNFGTSFLSNSNSTEPSFHILKFDIKPPQIRGNAYINFEANDSMKMSIPTDEPDCNSIYKGSVSHVKNGKECLLVFDGENLRIEKVSTTMTAKHVRCDKGEEGEEMKAYMSQIPPITTPPVPITLPSTTVVPPTPPIINDDESGGESSSEDEDEQMLLDQIANSTQPPQPEISRLDQPVPTYIPSSQSSPTRTNSSTTYHPSPATTIPTPPSKNSSLLEDLMMSDSSDSDSSSDESEDEGSKPVAPLKPEPMDYMMDIKRIPSYDTLSKPIPKNDDIRDIITGGGFNLLSSDLQLSESSSDEED